MGKFQSFQEFLTTQSVQVPLMGFIVNLLLVALLSFVLSRVYTRYGHALNNRKMFASNFILIAMTTMLIISIVKSSLALSLGLVGALSIVRFRAAIKEPEELAYLFINIAIGLGLGAHQRTITVAAFVVIIGIIWLKSFSSSHEENTNLYLEITSHNPVKVELDQVVKELKKHCSGVNLRRFNETKEVLEASFLVEYDNFNNLNECKEALRKMGDNISITFLDNKGILSS